MAVLVLAPMQYSKLRGLTSVPIAHGKEAASQSFKAGELLIFVAGLLTVSTADPASIVAGMALHNASGVTGADVAYVELQEGVQFEMSFMTGSAADYIFLASDIGVAYGVGVSANKWFLDKAETSATLFRVSSELISPVGDTNARVLVDVVTGKYLP